MPQAVTISSLDELLIHSGKVIAGEATWQNVDILPNSIIVPVVAQGHHLDKRVDVRSANLIQKIQKRADNLYAKYNSEGAERAPLIKVESKQGSNWLDFDLTVVIKQVLTTLPPGEISVLITLLIAGGFGLGGIWLVARHRENMAGSNLIKKALEINESVAAQALGSRSAITEPIRSYAHALGENALLSVAGSPPMPTSEIKQTLAAPRQRLSTFHVSCDGTFELLGLGLERVPPTLRISQDGNAPVTATITRLSQEMQETLVKKVEDCLVESSLPQPIQLQANAYFNEKLRKDIAIVGVGAPRVGLVHYKLDDIPHHVMFADAAPGGFDL